MDNNSNFNKVSTYKKNKQGSYNQAGSGLEYGKIPPQALDLEEAVLGAMMLEQYAINKVIDILQPDMFYKQAHIHIFEAIKALFGKSEPVDILTVKKELGLLGNLDIAGGSFYIMQLTEKVSSAANVEFHARIIQQKYIQRELIRISSNIIKDAFEETTDVLDLLDRAESSLFTVAENNLRRSASNMEDVVKLAIGKIEEASKNEGDISGIPSGFHKLDNLTAGWQPSDLIVLAARPGMGKTAFVLSLARNVAVDYGRAVAVFSLEMAAVQLVTRLISSESQISGDQLKKGNLSPQEWATLTERISGLSKAKLFIDDTPALTIFELRAKSRRLKSQHNIQMIIIDYLQLMTVGSDNSGNREQEISLISRSLKALAKELELPVIALSQLSRNVETRGGTKRPMLSDLRESGAIEQDADMVCFLYRPEYYKIEANENNEPYPSGYTELIVAKHRNGALEDIPMKFEHNYAKFVNLTESFGDEYDDGMMPNNDFDSQATIIGSKMNDDSGFSDNNEDHTPF
ncbi:MAG: replicative DNA helicase [Bacteroidales bacterium]|nr:replicative DNA helicase [Bacteroidales bacterium]